MNDDDWFREAAEAAAALPRARSARGAEATKAAREKAHLEEVRAALNPRTAASAEALRAFAKAAATLGSTVGIGMDGPPSKYSSGGIVAAPRGRAGISGGSYTNPPTARPDREITPERGLEAIVRAIKKDEDPFSAVGYWLTKITTTLTEILKEQEQDQD